MISTLYNKNFIPIITITLLLLACSEFLEDYQNIAGANKVSAPAFSPAAGTYDLAQVVTITSPANGSTILYTTDGTTPTHVDGSPTATTLTYNSPINVSADVTINAIAYHPGKSDSSMTSASYVIRVDVSPTPQFSPVAGLFSRSQGITIYSTLGGTILYTTDGSTPTHTNGNPTGSTVVYSSVINVANNTTIKAVLYKSGLADSTIATADYKICPANYVAVPANSVVGTTSDFCAAKYEMKCTSDPMGVACTGTPLSQAANLPWQANQTIAKAACTSLGSGYHLITNPEWMTIARNIEAVPSNWSSGTVNSGSINRGHSNNTGGVFLAAGSDVDPCSGVGQTCSDTTWAQLKRTHTLSNKATIWDLAGNAFEVIDWNVDVNDKASPTAGFIEINSVVETAAMPASSFKSKNTALTSANGIGQYNPGTSGSGGVAMRGGTKASGNQAGIYSLATSTSTTFVADGFRCAYAP